MVTLRSIALLATTLLIGSTVRAAAENVLRFTSASGGAVTMDPHARWQVPDMAASRQVYEALLDIDSNLAIVPQLAVAWKIMDPTHWEFELRRGVRFHDGTPFTADDVAFSLERARARTSDFRTPVADVTTVEAIDEHTVQIVTASPDPLLWMRLSNIAIMSKAWAQAHDVQSPANASSGEETYASRHANGTGPFMLQEFEPHGRWVMIRNPDWWGTVQYPHNIDRIVHTWKDDAGNLEDLLNGRIDLLQAPVYSGVAPIRSNPNLKLVYRPKLFTAFFGFDQASVELRSSSIKGRNPFKDRRVREAIYLAIDLGPVLRELMGDLFIPAGMMVTPGANGYIPELDRPARRDPERAKALLAEAGYPKGFSVTLDCPKDYGDDEIMTCRGAEDQLRAIGIVVSINFLSSEQIVSQVEQRHESDFFLELWGFDVDSEGLLRELFQSHSRYNFAHYANPRIDELIEKIGGAMVTYARDAYLEEAWRIVTGDLVYLPVRHGVSVFAMRKDLDMPPDPFDVPHFRLARFTGQKINLTRVPSQRELQ
jgi:peptide/nickel transport system substrate-binding protein